ncbi:MAG: hypothetical protein ACRDTA_24805 [Pseudonocardiaceae bacterium]
MPSVIGQDTTASGFDPGLENPPIPFGVWGDSGDGTGVIGSSAGIGVTAVSTSGTALHARHQDTSGTVIDARLATPALAGDFSGDVKISGALAIGASGASPPVGQPAGELRAGQSGGLELRVSNPTDQIHLGHEIGSFATLSIATEQVVVRRDDGTPTLTFDTAAGNLGIGAGTTPRTALHLPDRGLQIGTSTTATDNFHWTTDTVGGPRGLRLYRGNHGAGTHALTVQSSTGRIGVNNPAPLARLHVRDGGGFGAEDGNGVAITSNVPLLAQSNSTAIGILNAQGRPAFALNIDNNGGSATARGVPTFYDRFNGNWNAAISLRNGFVGMGTASPTSRLDVLGSGSTAAVQAINTGAASAVRAQNTGNGPAVSAEAVSTTGVSVRSGTGIAICGISRTNIGVFALSNEGQGLFAGGTPAARFGGNVEVTGTLSKQGGQFKIDHPLDPANRYLCHSFVESSEMKNVYDGVVELDANGAAEVRLEDWCETLNERFRYQLTPIGGPAPGLHIAAEVSAGRFSIAGGEPGMRISWQLTGVRHDPYALAHPLVVEEEKPEAERGHYLSPDLYDQPADRSIEWGRDPRGMRLLTLQMRRLNAGARGNDSEE